MANLRTPNRASDREVYAYFSERMDHFKDLEKMYRDGYLYAYNAKGYIQLKPKEGKEI